MVVCVRASQCVGCRGFPCRDVDSKCYVVPDVELDPEEIKVVMISEAAPPVRRDYYYDASGDSVFQKTTLQAFEDAGLKAGSIWDLVEKGVYFTTAVKCGKTGYGVSAASIQECSKILEAELRLFPGALVYLLMGDVAIKALNYISKRSIGKYAVPSGSTYKIRKGEYFFGDKRVYPSYLQAGPAFFIEKSKRRMIEEDIRNALNVSGLS